MWTASRRRLPSRIWCTCPLSHSEHHRRCIACLCHLVSNGSSMQRKIAIIDLGSNTTRLVILAYTPGVSFQLIDQVRERVRLSEGMGAENTLRPEPIERTVRIMKVFKALCDANDIDTIVATATSA